MAMFRQPKQDASNTMFGREVSGVIRVKRFFRVVKRVRCNPGVFRDESFAVADMPLSPFKFVKLGKILDEVLIGLKRFGHLT